MNNIKKTWEGIRKIANIKKMSMKTTQLNIGGRVIDDETVLAKNFNNFFANVGCKYVDLNSFDIFKDDNKTFSIIHLNIASLEKHKDELEKVLSMLNFKFDLIGISETKIKKGIDPNFNVEIKGYKHLSTLTESDKGGVIIYIAKHHDCKPMEDLDAIVYKTYVLEAVCGNYHTK